MSDVSTPASVPKEEIAARFQAAVSFIKSLPAAGAAGPSPVSLSNEDKLRFYALYKQATEGACNTPQPGFFDMVGKYKWDAWRRLGDKDKTQAMQEYVESLLERAGQMPPSADLTRFVDAVTPVRRKAREEEHGQTAAAASRSGGARSGEAVDEQEAESVKREEERLTGQVDALHESVRQESLRVARLEALLQGGGQRVEASVAVDDRELLDTLRLVEEGLREGQRERAELGARLAEFERLGERVQEQVRQTRAMLVSVGWLMAGAAVVLPLLAYGASALARRK